MISSHTIDRPMLIDDKIWYRLGNSWMTYNVKLNSHSFVADFPDTISSTRINGSCVTDGHFIYSLDKNRNIMVYDTQNNVYSIKITTNKPPDFMEHRFSLMLNGNIFMNTNFGINIRSQKFKSLRQANVSPHNRNWKRRRYIKDQKTNELFTMDEQLGGEFHVIQDLKETDDEYLCKLSDCQPIIPFTTFTVQNFMLYDHYIFSHSIINVVGIDKCLRLIIQDIEHDVEQNGHLKSYGIKDINISFYLQEMIVVDHYDDMNKFIVSRFVKQVNNKLYIPHDILSLIVLFHGDYYNKKIHFFDGFSYGPDTPHRSYHDQMSLGVAINTFIQKTQKEEIKKEQATKEIATTEEKDEVKEFENVLNEWKLIKNEGDELNEKLSKRHETGNVQKKKISKKERKEIEAAEDEVMESENMVNEWKSINNDQNELIEKLLKEYERLNKRNKSLKQKLKMIEN